MTTALSPRPEGVKPAGRLAAQRAMDSMIQTIRSEATPSPYPLVDEAVWSDLPHTWVHPGVIVYGIPGQRQRGNYYYTASTVDRTEWLGRRLPSIDQVREAVETAAARLRRKGVQPPPIVTVRQAILDALRDGPAMGRTALPHWAHVRLRTTGSPGTLDEIKGAIAVLVESGALVLEQDPDPTSRAKRILYRLVDA